MTDAHGEGLRGSEVEPSASLRLLLDEVSDLHSFLGFLGALREDREAADRKQVLNPIGSFKTWNGWENNSIATFLESAGAWAHDHRRGDPEFLSDENPWKAAARILYAGKHYE